MFSFETVVFKQKKIIKGGPTGTSLDYFSVINSNSLNGS